MISGFSRHLLSEFDDYNAQALSRIQATNPDDSMTAYTMTIADADPLYCWAREEPLFTTLMTEAELAVVLSKEDATIQGMVRD
jgi:hypothetical protein